MAVEKKIPIGQRIADILKKIDQRQKWLSITSGLPPHDISRTINNLRNPSRQDLEKIAKALEIDLAELVHGTTAEDTIDKEMQTVPLEQYQAVLHAYNTSQVAFAEFKAQADKRLEEVQNTVEQREKKRTDEVARLNKELAKRDDTIASFERRCGNLDRKISSLIVAKEQAVDSLTQMQAQFASAQALSKKLWHAYSELCKKYNEQRQQLQSKGGDTFFAGLVGMGLGAFAVTKSRER